MPKITPALLLSLVLISFAGCASREAGQTENGTQLRLRDMENRVRDQERRAEQDYQDRREETKKRQSHQRRMEEMREQSRHKENKRRSARSPVAPEPSAQLDEQDAALVLAFFEGEPSRMQRYQWAQEPPQTGIFRVEWTYSYRGNDYTISTELDAGFIPDSDKIYLPLVQSTYPSDSIQNYDRVRERYLPNWLSRRNVYGLFINRSHLVFQFNARAYDASDFSRFRDVRITRVP